MHVFTRFTDDTECQADALNPLLDTHLVVEKRKGYQSGSTHLVIEHRTEIRCGFCNGSAESQGGGEPKF